MVFFVGQDLFDAIDVAVVYGSGDVSGVSDGGYGAVGGVAGAEVDIPMVFDVDEVVEAW